MLITDARIVAATGVIERGWLRIQGTQIVAVSTGDAPAALDGETAFGLAGRTVLPGFIDLHVHGGGGASYTSGDPAEVRRARAFHRAAGTTRSLASLVTAPLDELCAALEALAPLVEEGVIDGIHLEGPFISAARCGVHDTRYLLAPDLAVLQRLLVAGRGGVRMITVAPELPGGLELVEHISAAGVVPAIGHSDATYAEATQAVIAGARVATHLFNAMRPFHHREPGIIGAALDAREVSCELIVDGQHVDAAALRIAFDAAAGRTLLVTDAMSAAGAADGCYALGPARVQVVGGRAFLAGTDTIAGSTATMAQVVRYALAEVGLPLAAVAAAAATLPARVLGVDGRVGSVEAGKEADLVVLDDALAVEYVIAKGEVVRSADEEPLPV